MSKELKQLEKRATQQYITDHDHIDRIMKYILSLPLSVFQNDEVRYRYLQKDLCSGFGIGRGDLDGISLEDTLILIGYEPGTPYFDPPDSEKRRWGKKFNAAGDCYVLALLINSLSKKDIRIKEFYHIRLTAYTDYLEKKVEAEYKNKLILFPSYTFIKHKIEMFRHKSSRYMIKASPSEAFLSADITLGDLMNRSITVCARAWMCAVKPLEVYCSEITESYDVLNRLFMDAVRMPLICSGRERFQEIIASYGNSPEADTVDIDYETCYEPNRLTNNK